MPEPEDPAEWARREDDFERELDALARRERSLQFA
jgi:hypothetical protein